jgi:uncharacterized protein YbdZ (MbtH family)
MRPACAIYNGAKVLVVVVASGVALYELWQVFLQEKDSPVGWPGDGPYTCPAGWKPKTAKLGSHTACISMVEVFILTLATRPMALTGITMTT